MTAPRRLLLHYHVFKNAGTSVDRMLQRNFGDHWINIEFREPAPLHAERFAAFFAENPALSAISSHTLMAPVPANENTEVLPIVFIRHPIDRLKSSYEFERLQPDDTFGARLAKQADFKGYLEGRWERPQDRFARNMQAHRLSRIIGRPGLAQERAVAFAALDELPFVGLVEAYDASIERLEGLAKRLFPDFQRYVVVANSYRDPTVPLRERLAGIREEVGDAFYRRIEAENELDLDLHQKLCRRYGLV